MIDKYIIEEDLCKDICEYPMNNIHVWNQDGWEFRISPSYKDIGVFYFKLYDNSIIEKSLKQARISLLSPEYIIPPFNYKEIWELNISEKKKLMSILSSKFEYDRSSYMHEINNIYDYIKYMYIEQRFGMHGLASPEKLMNSSLPNYILLP